MGRRRRLKGAVAWWCDEEGLSLLAPNGRRTLIDVRSFSHKEIVVRVLGRDHKFVHGSRYVYKEHLYNEPKLTEAEYYGLWEFANAFMRGAFAGIQPRWTAKDSYLWIEGPEPVKVCKIRHDGLTIAWHGVEYGFWPGMLRDETYADRPALNPAIWKTFFHLTALLCALLPVPKSQDERDAKAIARAPETPLFADAPATAPVRKRRFRKRAVPHDPAQLQLF